MTDGDRVLQVITNLLANAFRWTPDGGTVSLGSATANGVVRIDVRDTGPASSPRSASGSSRRSSRVTTTARASGFRSRASSPSRSAAGSSSSRRSARAAASGSCCRPVRRRARSRQRRVASVALEGQAPLRSRDGRARTAGGRRRAPATAVAARAAFVALRPRQWLKNLLLFAGIIFAAELGDASRWLEAVAAFVAYCAASSAAYLVNDLRDAASDRLHPVKRRRPIARGELRPRTAVVLASALAVVRAGDRRRRSGRPRSRAWSGSWRSRPPTRSRLKHIVLVDVLVIAALFVIRAAAGAVAVEVRISPWLLVCTGLLALFLALGKRRAELVLVGAERTPGRPVLEGYSLALVDQLLAAVAGATIVAYALYTVTARDSYALVATVPFVVFGLFRYLHLLHRQRRRGGAGEHPARRPADSRHGRGLGALCAAILVVVGRAGRPRDAGVTTPARRSPTRRRRGGRAARRSRPCRRARSARGAGRRPASRTRSGRRGA